MAALTSKQRVYRVREGSYSCDQCVLGFSDALANYRAAIDNVGALLGLTASITGLDKSFLI